MEIGIRRIYMELHRSSVRDDPLFTDLLQFCVELILGLYIGTGLETYRRNDVLLLL